MEKRKIFVPQDCGDDEMLGEQRPDPPERKRATGTTPRAAENRRTGPEVALYLASAGNHFMAEIARIFLEGFRVMGVEAALRVDEVPSAEQNSPRIQVVVAPHEFLLLFLERKLGAGAWKRVAASCYCLNTEQPGSGWFEAAYRFARRCKGVFDINRQGAAEFTKRGIRADHTPLGYAPLLEETGFAGRSPLPWDPNAGPLTSRSPLPRDPQEKDIDILFLGHYSPRRGVFLARHAERLQEYRCALVLPDSDQPRLATSPGSFGGIERNRLVRRARILLNVHSSNRRYFEWHRALVCMANRCALVSEESQTIEPLVDGEHLVLADLDHLMDRCEELLGDEPRRQEMAERAYEFLRAGLSIEPACRTILESAKSGQGARVPASECRGSHWQRNSRGSGVRRSYFQWDPRRPLSRVAPFVSHELAIATAWHRGHGALRGAAFQLCRLARDYPNYLRRQRPAHLLYYPVRSFFDRLRGRWSLKEIERRRREILDRCGDGQGPCSRVVHEDYEPLANEAYPGDPSLAVSVVVTVYNYARFVGECLGSVARASLEDLPGGIELVVVDDASNDGSAEVVETHLRKLALPARLLRKRWNTGVADARNLGIHLARAPYVFMLDADNWIFPRCLGRLYQTIAGSGAAAAYGVIRKFDSRTLRPLGLLSCQAWDVKRLIAGPYIDTMAMFDRQRLLAVGGYSTELIRYGWFGWEDYDLWLKFARAGYTCQFCPQIVASYRVHSAPMNRITLHYKPRLARYFREKFSSLLEEHPPGRLRFGYVDGCGRS